MVPAVYEKYYVILSIPVEPNSSLSQKYKIYLKLSSYTHKKNC